MLSQLKTLSQLGGTDSVSDLVDGGSSVTVSVAAMVVVVLLEVVFLFSPVMFGDLKIKLSSPPHLHFSMFHFEKVEVISDECLLNN